MSIFVDFLNALKAVIEMKNVISNNKHLSSSVLHDQEFQQMIFNIFLSNFMSILIINIMKKYEF